MSVKFYLQKKILLRQNSSTKQKLYKTAINLFIFRHSKNMNLVLLAIMYILYICMIKKINWSSFSRQKSQNCCNASKKHHVLAKIRLNINQLLVNFIRNNTHHNILR